MDDQLSEKILFEEIRPGQIVTVDVDDWDGEGPFEDAAFMLTGACKLPAEPDRSTAGAHAASKGPAAQ